MRKLTANERYRIETTKAMPESAEDILQKFAQVLYDKGAYNILALDVRGVSTMTDFFLIAEGNVDRHVIALMRYIVEEGEKLGIKPFHVEGSQTGDWVVVDYVDIVIHLFLSDLRQSYSLEELWGEGKIVDLDIKVS